MALKSGAWHVRHRPPFTAQCGQQPLAADGVRLATACCLFCNTQFVSVLEAACAATLQVPVRLCLQTAVLSSLSAHHQIDIKYGVPGMVSQPAAMHFYCGKCCKARHAQKHRLVMSTAYLAWTVRCSLLQVMAVPCSASTRSCPNSCKNCSLWPCIFVVFVGEQKRSACFVVCVMQHHMTSPVCHVGSGCLSSSQCC